MDRYALILIAYFSSGFCAKPDANSTWSEGLSERRGEYHTTSLYLLYLDQSLLLALLHFINALPLLNTVFPASTLVKNLISSHPSLKSPVLHASVTSSSPGLKTCLKFAEVGRITVAGRLEQRVTGRVLRIQAVHDGASEPHFLARFGSYV